MSCPSEFENIRSDLKIPHVQISTCQLSERVFLSSSCHVVLLFDLFSSIRSSRHGQNESIKPEPIEFSRQKSLCQTSPLQGRGMDHITPYWNPAYSTNTSILHANNVRLAKAYYLYLVQLVIPMLYCEKTSKVIQGRISTTQSVMQNLVYF